MDTLITSLKLFPTFVLLSALVILSRADLLRYDKIQRFSSYNLSPLTV